MVKLLNLVKVNISTTGTGTVTFGSAFSNAFFTPSEAGAADGDNVSYVLVEGDDTEIGTGVIGSSVTTMTRTVIKSKISGVAGTTKMTLGGTAWLAFTALDRDIALSGANSDITSLSALTNATLQASPANPMLTTSSTAVMMGLGGTCKLTPGASGRIRLTFQGTINPSLSGVIGNIQVKYGTGTAPSNGAAATGTSLGSNVQIAVAAANTYFPFSVGGIITGLTPGTAYWFDLSIFVTGGGNLSVFNISCSAMEF